MSRGIMMMLFITFVCVIGCLIFYECTNEKEGRSGRGGQF